ncbi:CUB and LDLa domain isoform 3-T3 [Cochliomyia hominivorax]
MFFYQSFKKGLNIVCVRNCIIVKLLVFLYFLNFFVTAYPPNTYRDLDICNHWNGRRHFLELGERGDLHARNVTTSAFRVRNTTLYAPQSSINGNSLKNRSNLDYWYQCNLELVTCADCVIRITFTFTNFSKNCERVGTTALGKSLMCPCEHLQFSEPPYDSSISGQEFCGDEKVFRSKTRTLLLKFFYRATNIHVFSLQYFSERNVQIVSGSPYQSSNNDDTPQIISTPYFPMTYPRDYGTEQILTCEADNCNVRLDFTDFQLGVTSTLEIFDSNGQMVDSYNGEHFRPPIIISTGKSLLLQFRGNGVTGCGFRAEVTFVSPKQKDDRLMPYTDCGGLVSGPGGAITMMNMIENATDVRFFDCIWIIKPGNNYLMMKTHISLRIEEFHSMASRSDLTIRQGTTSDSMEIENVVWPNNGVSKETHVVPILTGYYIRLRGVFGMSSKLAIVYSVFNYLNCYIGSEFLCSNNHCISIRLHCDGFDHCGDGSDEPESCEDDWANLQNDRRWYSHKPNYYFPKIEQYPDLKTATGIFIISTLGIFAVLSGWMVILYRMGVRARHQRELQNHLQTISELLDRQEDITTPDEPPSYEAPPDYEEVIKIGMEQEMREPRDRHRKHHRRHRDCSRVPSNVTVSSTIPFHNCSDRPSTSAAAACSLTSENTITPAVILNDIASTSSTCQELTQHVIRATQNCGIAVTSQTSEATTTKSKCHCKCKDEENKRDHLATSPIAENISQNINSCNTTTQLEECSHDFSDDTLNISFSLGIPQTNTAGNTENNCDHASGRPKSSVNCTEQTYLKKSWIVMNSGGQTYKVQRLRPTFSSPESFLHDWSFYGDSQNYGSILPHEKSFILSNNTSNFISDLSRDPSANSIESQNSKTRLKSPATTCTISCSTSSNTNNNNYNNNNNTNESSITLYEDEREELSYSSSTSSSSKQQRSGRNTQLLLMSEMESDDGGDQNISCFGTVNNPFKINAKIKYSAVGRTHVRRRHARSRSFTNSGNERSTHSLRRTSSADLLLNLRPISDIFYSDNSQANSYII